MTRDVLAHALAAEGFYPENGVYAIPEARDATCFVSATGDLLNVARVVEIELRERYVHLQTSRNERLVFDYDGVLGLRLVPRRLFERRRAVGGTRAAAARTAPELSAAR